jgi:hypothetical protein
MRSVSYLKLLNSPFMPATFEPRVTALQQQAIERRLIAL